MNLCMEVISDWVCQFLQLINDETETIIVGAEKEWLYVRSHIKGLIGKPHIDMTTKLSLHPLQNKG